MKLWPQKWKVGVRWHSALTASFVVALMFLYWPIAGIIMAMGVDAQVSLIAKAVITAMLVVLAVYVANQAWQLVYKYDQGDPAK
jgi:hypothetical protein